MVVTPMSKTLDLNNRSVERQRCRKVMKSGGGGNIFDYDLGGSGGMPPRKFLVFSCSETAPSAI